MPKLNPNVCPRCGSSDTGATFGFNPVRINSNETLIHDVLFRCADCDRQYQAIGYSMIASRSGEYSPEALTALAEAIDASESLRLVPVDDEEDAA
jgi:transposase-like protein